MTSIIQALINELSFSHKASARKRFSAIILSGPCRRPLIQSWHHRCFWLERGLGRGRGRITETKKSREHAAAGGALAHRDQPLERCTVVEVGESVFPLSSWSHG